MNNFYIKYFLLIIFNFQLVTLFSQVVINEYSCSNRSIPDSFGNFEDWIEFYNPTSSPVDLTGYYLSDKVNNPLKWQFPGGVVPAGGHLLVICSGRDVLAGSIPHTNFRLNQLTPESIVFSDPSGNILESYNLETTQNTHSNGRASDGAADWGVFTNSTLGVSNNASTVYDSYAEKPQFSLQAGFYNGGVNLSISVLDPTLEIRYTTNGNEPTLASNLYNGPISINSTQVIRARTFSSNPAILPSFIETNTYFIDESHSLPVVSVSGDQLPTLFGGSQIDPIGSLEYFDENGFFIDEAIGDYNKHGNDSWAYPHRGVDFIARDQYGYNDEIEHQIFQTSSRTKFKRLILKAGASDNYPFENGGAHIRDPFVQHLSQLGNLELDERSVTFCALYMNGSYWGLYDIREKVDDHDYTDFYYNQERTYKGSEEYVQFLKTWGGTWIEYGEAPALNDWNSLRDFVQNNDMSIAANYNQVLEELDFKSLVDYFIFNSYIVQQDWLNWNTGWWRGLNPNGTGTKWRYILWDLDACFGHYVNFTGIPDVSPSADPCFAENLPNPGGQGHTNILSKLIDENEDAANYYASRYADLLNSVLSCDYMLNVLDSMVNVIEPEMVNQIARWGGTMQEWESNVQDIRDFITARCAVINDGMVDCYELEGPYEVVIRVVPEDAGIVRMNTVWLDEYPNEVNIFGGLTTTFEALGQGPFSFDTWEIQNNTISPNLTSNEITIDFNSVDTLTAYFIDTTVNDKELIYYWHFNTLETPNDVTSIDADYSLILGADPKMQYIGSSNRDMDEFGNGSALNLQLGENEGKGVRVRNRSEDRWLEFNMPTTGYEDFVFEYAVQRSGSGMLQNIIFYSIDGVNFIQDDLLQTTFDVEEGYNHVLVDLSHITSINNQEDFKIRIDFQGNTDQLNGNNRFDNITLKGIDSELPPPPPLVEDSADLVIIISPSSGGNLLVNGELVDVSPSTGTYPINQMIELQANPANGYFFDKWVLNNSTLPDFFTNTEFLFNTQDTLFAYFKSPSSLNEVDNVFEYIKLYPTVTNNLVNVEFELHKSSEVLFELYSLNGSLVKSLLKENLMPNQLYKKSFNIQEVSSGLYFLKVLTNEGIATFKVIKSD